MKKFKNLVKNKDMFGHKVQINFEGNKTSHKTLIGGVVSIIVALSLFDMVLTKFLTMITRSNNTVVAYSSNYDLNENPGVNLN